MRFVVAMDSFKGSLTSLEAGNAVKRGIERACPEAEVTVIPLADGGEGTLDAIVSVTGGENISCKVRDPLGRLIKAEYVILPDGTAVVEMHRDAIAPGQKAQMKVAVDSRFLGMSKAQPRILIITNDPKMPKAVINVKFE